MSFASSDGPAIAALPVTPSNSTVFTHVTHSVYVGGGGDLVVHWPTSNNSTFPNADGYSNTTIFKSVPTGTTLHIRIDQVMTSTTANNIVALF